METVKKRCRRCGCVLKRKINIKQKVSNLQLPNIDRVAFMLNKFVRQIEITSEVDSDAKADSDSDTVIVGDGDVGNLNDF